MTIETPSEIISKEVRASQGEKLSPQKNIININGRQIDTFFQILETRGLALLLKFPELSPKLDKRSCIHASIQRVEIYRAFVDFREVIRNNNSELPDNLSYRSVNFKNIQEVDFAIQNSAVDGGKHPADTRVGVCVSTTDKALEMAKTKLLQDGQPGVIFVYDSDKLQPLSKKEIEEDESLNFVGGYGVKPIDGYNLSDTLVCVIRLEAPVANPNQ